LQRGFRFIRNIRKVFDTKSKDSRIFVAIEIFLDQEPKIIEYSYEKNFHFEHFTYTSVEQKAIKIQVCDLSVLVEPPTSKMVFKSMNLKIKYE